MNKDNPKNAGIASVAPRSPADPPHVPLDWSNVRIKLGRHGRSVWRQGHSIPMDWFVWPLPDYDLWFFFRGKGRVRDLLGEEAPLGPGSCLWLRPGDRLEFAQDQPGPCLGDAYVHFDLFDGEGTPIPRSRIAGIPILFETFDFKFFDLTTQRIISLLRDPSDQQVSTSREMEAELLLKCLLMEFESGAQTQARHLEEGIDLRHQRTIREIVARIHEDPSRISGVETLAKSSGYSLDYFTRIFKRVTGSTPNALIIETKLEKARALLAAPDLTIEQISIDLGYNNPFYFTRQFKQKTGMTPSQYRKKFQE